MKYSQLVENQNKNPAPEVQPQAAEQEEKVPVVMSQESLPLTLPVLEALNGIEKPAIREPGDDLEEQVAEVMYKLFGPLSYFDWFTMLCAFWSFSEDYKTTWAPFWHEKIKAVDIDWIRRAMNWTWATLTDEHKNLLREEYRMWREHDKVFDWKSMARGHEHIAVVCTESFPDVRLKRSVYAWSFAEAEAKFKPGKCEILLGWMNPGDKDYTPVAPVTIGEVPF
jgi:hypothetical protein